MKLWSTLTLAVTLVMAVSVSAQELKIGFVDLQRALNDSNSGQKAKKEFKKQVDRMQEQLKSQKNRLEGLKAELEKKALVMKEEERRELEKDYQRQLRDFERSYKDTQAELQQRDNELTAGLLQELQVVIAIFGEEQGYTIILEQASSSVLYGAPQIDLTNQIIRAYNDSK